MAEIDVSVSKELLPGLLGSPDGLAKLVEAVLNQIFEAQVTQALGAARHERSEERTGYRNGYRRHAALGAPRYLSSVFNLQPAKKESGHWSMDITRYYPNSRRARSVSMSRRPSAMR